MSIAIGTYVSFQERDGTSPATTRTSTRRDATTGAITSMAPLALAVLLLM